MPYKSIKTGDLPIPEFHGFLLGAISPRPIAFASTIDKEGNVNLSPFSFFNVFGANPPIMIFSPARRVRGNTTKHSLENAKVSGEVVINVVNFEMVQQMSLSSTEYAQGVNEFEKAGFTMLDSVMVGPPRVAESPAQFECKVISIIETGKEGGAGNLIVCEVLTSHFNEKVLDANGKIDLKKIDLVARMGGNWYSRAKEGMFEVEKPLRSHGVGVDVIPIAIRQSRVLSANHLGVLGNVEKLPSKSESEAYYQQNTTLQSIVNSANGDAILIENLTHAYAASLIEELKSIEAWKVLLSL